jgi:uncharacterized membrane protein YqjE
MATESNHAPRPGTLRSVLGRIVSLLLVRAELLSIEAQEHKIALVNNLVIVAAAFACMLVGLMAGMLFLTLIMPPAWRVPVLGCLALGFVMLAAFALWRLKRRFDQQKSPFSQTLSELQKDWEVVSGKD